MMMGGTDGGSICREFLFQCISFFVRQPLSMVRLIGQQIEDSDTDQHRRYTPENVNPLPSFQSQHVRMGDRDSVNHYCSTNIQEPPRNRRTNNHCNRRCDQKIRHRTGTIARGKPMREIDQYAGKESRLRNS